jgi:hypothetical protein
MADAAEGVILQGYAVTAVLLATEQAVVTQGYGAAAGPLPVLPDPAPTCHFRAAGGARFRARVKC